MIFIKSRNCKIPELSKIPVRITAKYANLRKIPWKLRKICELRQNPVRITQNMRTYAKSRENYAKYANLRKIPWELRQICELTQNPRDNYAKYTNLRKIPWELRKNKRTYAKSRENYAKYANLRKIPWELRKLCELTQNPVRITNLTWALYTTISLYITTTEGRSNELSSLYSSSFREFFAKNHRQYCIDFFNSSPIFRRFPRS